jgi:hypothetical protein
MSERAVPAIAFACARRLRDRLCENPFVPQHAASYQNVLLTNRKDKKSQDDSMVRLDCQRKMRLLRRVQLFCSWSRSATLYS